MWCDFSKVEKAGGYKKAGQLSGLNNGSSIWLNIFCF